PGPSDPPGPGQAGGRPAAPPPAARELLHRALAHTYARWGPHTDPYDTARWQLVHRFTRHARRHRHSLGGPLGDLTPQERVVLVLCVYEEVDEDRVAASLGLPADRVRALRARSVYRLRAARRPAPEVRR
ncbi:RNA polymerase, partial [Streptomyces sp. OF3]